jgi:hypothetical protein
MTVLTPSTALEAPVLPTEAPFVPPAGWGRTARPRPEAALVGVGTRPDAGAPTDIVDQWGEQSFPASDPPANW